MHCHGQNAHAHPKQTHIPKPSPRCKRTGGEAFGWRLDQEWNVGKGSVPLLKMPQGAPLCHVRTQRKKAVYEPGSGTWFKFDGTLTLDFPAFRTGRNPFRLCVSHSVSGNVLQQPKRTGTYAYVQILSLVSNNRPLTRNWQDPGAGL